MEQGLLIAAISLGCLAGGVFCFASCARSTSLLARIAFVVVGAGMGAVGLFTIFDLAALPQMVGDAWFGSNVRVGMTRDEVDRLASRTGGAVVPGFGTRGYPDPHTQVVRYFTGGMVCVEWGDAYDLVYDRSDRLAFWRKSTWGDGC